MIDLLRRRSELLSLGLDEIQMRQGQWAVVDLVGKGGHIRTVRFRWVKAALDQWTAAAGSRREGFFERSPGPERYGGKACRRMLCGT
jgi:integrase